MATSDKSNRKEPGAMDHDELTMDRQDQPEEEPQVSASPENQRLESRNETAGIIRNDDFNRAFDLLENSRESVFITGQAGSGKSTLLRFFRENTKKNVVVLAPTGLAAINVGGQTIHSFFKFPPAFINESSVKDLDDPAFFRKIDTVVIDEISMVRADLISGIDRSLQINRRHS